MTAAPDPDQKQGHPGGQSASEHDKLLRLSHVIVLEEEARRQKDIESLSFLIVNKTKLLIEYRQALLFLQENGKVRIRSASGLSGLAAEDSPFLQWLQEFLARKLKDTTTPSLIDSESLEEQDRASWKDWLSRYLLLLPFTDTKGNVIGGLILQLDSAPGEGEKRLVEHLCGFYAQQIELILAAGHRQSILPLAFMQQAGLTVWLCLAVLLAIMLFPVRLSTTAPAEIVPRAPLVVPSPIDGTISQIHIAPNADVTAGTLLFTMDDTVLKGQAESAVKEYDVARAAYEKVRRESFSDSTRSAEIALLATEAEAKRLKAEYARELLQKTVIHAQKDGTVIFDDPNLLRGRPVRTGEKIMLLADPQDIELLSRVPADALIGINPDIPARFFLNIRPFKGHTARMRYISFEASPDPDGLVTYKLKAVLNENRKDDLRIGLRGQSKIYGDYTVLGYQILRRPLLALRIQLGL